MKLIDQHTKRIMEECKLRARDAGLVFTDESLEYIVTNRDMIELSPKIMIPTMYDYWVHDVEVLHGSGKYELYPHNAYETVINTRPPVSFYNDNNPDWLNVMIFYHVIGHIDFFQNNEFFSSTWNFDMCGRALADKRLIARLRSEHGRWVDYVIECARAVDNLVGYFDEINMPDDRCEAGLSARINYFFDVFLQDEKKLKVAEFVAEIERFNRCRTGLSDKLAEDSFMVDVHKKYPEFEAMFAKSQISRTRSKQDIMQYIMDHSALLNREENIWMKQVIEIVRSTSIYFQPQIRTKIMNEGWASYWHDRLFLADERICGHEVDYARVNARVTAMPRVGQNPYALGMRLFEHIERMGDRDCYSHEYQREQSIALRRDFDRKTAGGSDLIFKVREELCDYTFLSKFVDQEFVDHHKLFVAGRRLNQRRMTWQYFVKSKSAVDYKQMLCNLLYHPPAISVGCDCEADKTLYLTHQFENRPLLGEYIDNAMKCIGWLWGGPIKLETNEVLKVNKKNDADPPQPEDVMWARVVYSLENKKITKWYR